MRYLCGIDLEWLHHFCSHYSAGAVYCNEINVIISWIRGGLGFILTFYLLLKHFVSVSLQFLIWFFFFFTLKRILFTCVFLILYNQTFIICHYPSRQSRLDGATEKCRNSCPCHFTQFSASSDSHKNSLFKSEAAWLARYLNWELWVIYGTHAGAGTCNVFLHHCGQVMWHDMYDTQLSYPVVEVFKQ